MIFAGPLLAALTLHAPPARHDGSSGSALNALRADSSAMTGWGRSRHFLQHPVLAHRHRSLAPAYLIAMSEEGAANTGLSNFFARAVGWVLTGAAMQIYVPMVISTLASRDATGMSAATWSLQLSGFLVFVVYHRRNELPLSTYADMLALSIQSAILLALICFFQRQLHAIALLPFVALAAALALPKAGLQRLQAASTVVTSAALLPQIMSNFAAHSRGGWSPISAGLSTIGNALRVFTTLKLANGNPLLLAQFGVNTLTNGILLVQSLVWP